MKPIISLLKENLITKKKRIDGLLKLLNGTNDFGVLVLLREVLLALYQEDPRDGRVKVLLNKVNTKINAV